MLKILQHILSLLGITFIVFYLLNVEFSQVTMEKSSDTRETKVAKSSCGIFHVPTVNDSHDKQLEKDMSSERKPARGKHENSMNKTRSATRSANSSQHNGVVNISKYHPKSKGTSAVNSGSSRSNVFKGKTFGFSNSFSHDKVCCFANIPPLPVLASFPYLCHLPFPLKMTLDPKLTGCSTPELKKWCN